MHHNGGGGAAAEHARPSSGAGEDPSGRSRSGNNHSGVRMARSNDNEAIRRMIVAKEVRLLTRAGAAPQWLPQCH